MFIGHFGIGFGTNKFAPTLSLGILFLAAQFLDLLWPALLLLNLEQVVISPGITKATPSDFVNYPISHSLIMAIVWGVLLGFISRALFENKKYSIVIFICVISHWFLDLLVHRPDFPLIPGDPTRVGLGLWDYPYVTALLEVVIFSAGLCNKCNI
ncbi:hypothetical protein BH23BAC1_BH23BAC1_07250 [soil metagenome]